MWIFWLQCIVYVSLLFDDFGLFLSYLIMYMDVKGVGGGGGVDEKYWVV